MNLNVKTNQRTINVEKCTGLDGLESQRPGQTESPSRLVEDFLSQVVGYQLVKNSIVIEWPLLTVRFIVCGCDNEV